MSVQPQPTIHPEEYLALDRAGEIKHELIDGEMVAMSGASRAHNLIVLNIGSELRQALKGKPCEAYPSDMRVHVPATGSYLYPDLTVVCGEPTFTDERGDVLLNPTLVIEVLSPSTEPFDRGRKFGLYRALPSLREYLLVAQDEARVERFSRRGSGQANDEWLFRESRGREETVELASIECRLALAEVYDKVTFAPSQSPATEEAGGQATS